MVWGHILPGRAGRMGRRGTSGRKEVTYGNAKNGPKMIKGEHQHCLLHSVKKLGFYMDLEQGREV